MKKTFTNEEMVMIVNAMHAMKERESKSGSLIFAGAIRVNYALKKNRDRLVDALKPYEEAREDLLKECVDTEQPQEGGKVAIRKDCAERFLKDSMELARISCEVDIHMVPFEDIEGLSLSMEDLDAIDFMIMEPETL